MKRLRPHLRYLSYVLRHKWFVFYAGVKWVGPPPGIRGLRHVRWWLKLAVHDWSKFLPSEWRPYVERFYGDTPPLKWPDEIVAILRPPFGDGFGPAWTPDLIAKMEARQNPPMAPSDWRSEREAAFRVAWAKHIHRSPHHWQHWLLTLDRPRTGEDAPLMRQDAQRVRLPMPERYYREMVADWAGAGRAITGTWDVARWYEEHQGNIKLHGDTRHAVERLLWRFMDPIHRTQVRSRIRVIAGDIGAALRGELPEEQQAAIEWAEEHPYRPDPIDTEDA